MDTIKATIYFEAAELQKLLENMTQARDSALVQKYGEVCTKTTAGRILGCSVQSVNAMLRDGRLKEACVGKKVDVRSVAEYISAQKNEESGKRSKRKIKYV